jgi:Leucine-rich repeat (LRR) protein
MSKFVTG